MLLLLLLRCYVVTYRSIEEEENWMSEKESTTSCSCVCGRVAATVLSHAALHVHHGTCTIGSMVSVAKVRRDRQFSYISW